MEKLISVKRSIAHLTTHEKKMYWQNVMDEALNKLNENKNHMDTALVDEIKKNITTACAELNKLINPK